MVLQKSGWSRNVGKCSKKIMKNAGFEGHYTNHSLRRSSASRLYDAGMPEQVIQETTGHRSSDGVKAYKCTSSSFKRKGSEILQGNLPKTKDDAKSKSMDDIYINRQTVRLMNVCLQAIQVKDL